MVIKPFQSFGHDPASLRTSNIGPLSMVLFIVLGLSGCSGGHTTFSGKWGFIDRKGKLVIPAKFSDAGQFSEGLALVSVGYTGTAKWGFVDSTGKLTIPTKFQRGLTFSEGVAAVCNQDKWGFIDHHGKSVINAKYDEAHSFSEGVAMVKSDEVWTCIDKAGQQLFQLKRGHEPGDFSEGLMEVKVPKNDKPSSKPDDFNPEDAGTLSGFVDKTGKFVIDPRFDMIDTVCTPDVFGKSRAFDQGVAFVEVGGVFDTSHWKWGLIDKKGNYILKPGFSSFIRFFNNGCASALLGGFGGRWAFVDSSGRVVKDKRFETPDGFSDGLAVADWGNISNHSLGYVDQTGKVVIKPQFGYAGRFSEGIACVEKKGTFGSRVVLIDKSGAEIAPLNFGYQQMWGSCPPEFHEGLARVCLGHWGPA